MSRFSSIFLLLGITAVMLAACRGVVAQVRDTEILRVIVLDSKDSAVPGASVSVKGADVSAAPCDEVRTGEFECRPAGKEGTVIVRAPGFEDLDIPADSASDGVLTARLAPAALNEQVVVSVSGSPASISETPASVVVIDRRQIEVSAAAAIDSVIRGRTGFSLFRRNDSTTANPTTQGASLRGLNPSGASRAGVLFEGVPLNDPFGGWVPWASVPKIAVESVEVLRGGVSSLYGSDSLSGLVNILPRKVSGRSAISAEAFAGPQSTVGFSSFSGLSRHGISLDGFGSFFNTSGYVPVAASERGIVDERAGSRSSALSLRLAPKFARIHPFIRLTYFDEARKNGTRLQRNETHSRRFLAGLDPSIGDPIAGTYDSSLSIRFYGLFQVYDQTFSGVAADRNSEFLSRLQRVPSKNLGLSLRFSTSAGSHFLLAGFEARGTSGASDESGFFNGNQAGISSSFGKERVLAANIQDVVKFGRTVVIGRVRADRWSNRAAFQATSQTVGPVNVTVYPDRSESALSPGVSVKVALSSSVSIYLGASRSFRAPTLNELYRGFRVGNILTLANEELKAERATGIEGGVSVLIENLSLRSSWFHNRVSNAVSNVTIDAGSSPILRQRRNAAGIGVSGLEIDGELSAGTIKATFGYLFSSSKYISFPSASELEGKTLPQSPAHQFNLNLMWNAPGSITLGVQTRASSAQFDDDLNMFRLRPYFRADALIAKRFRSIELFVSVENLLNTRFDIGVTPVRTVAAPIGFRSGIRWD